VILVAVLLLLESARAASPADLAPGAPELLAAEARLQELLVTSDAAARATGRLQVAWTVAATPPKVCDDAERLGVGWRIERFGAAWREASQAVRAEAERVRRVRAASTVAPLVDARWTTELDGLLARAEHDEHAFLEASAWEATWVRPALAACPAVPLAATDGVAMAEVAVRGEPAPSTAVIGMGDGWVCPGAVRGDDAVVIVAGEACWSASPTCGCTPVPVAPGAVLGPPPPEAPVDAGAVETAGATGTGATAAGAATGAKQAAPAAATGAAKGAAVEPKAGATKAGATKADGAPATKAGDAKAPSTGATKKTEDARTEDAKAEDAKAPATPAPVKKSGGGAR
jgi:hypothetical protein